MMKSLSISGLQKLKGIKALGIPDVSIIDAPSLENLCYFPVYPTTSFKIDFDRCGNLKKLWMWCVKGTFFTTKWFLELFPKVPFLEILKLHHCNMPDRIDILSVGLKVLELLQCSNLKEVNIDAPNLLLCDYKGAIGIGDDSGPTISLENPSQVEVNIEIGIFNVDLCKLREFVENIKPNNVLTSLSLSITVILNMDVLNQVALQVSSVPPSIQHLDILYVPDNECKHLFSSIVNNLLSCCCPATISFKRVFSCCNEFIEFFYETIMRRKVDNCDCSSYDTKCWWHDLKGVTVTSSMKMDENVDFKTILESLPPSASQEESISFRLDF